MKSKLGYLTGVSLNNDERSAYNTTANAKEKLKQNGFY